MNAMTPLEMRGLRAVPASFVAEEGAFDRFKAVTDSEMLFNPRGAPASFIVRFCEQRFRRARERGRGRRRVAKEAEG
jgi:hypothetical protein